MLSQSIRVHPGPGKAEEVGSQGMRLVAEEKMIDIGIDGLEVRVLG